MRIHHSKSGARNESQDRDSVSQRTRNQEFGGRSRFKRLKNEMAAQEHRHQQRREEDMQMWQRMMTIMMNGVEDRKRNKTENGDESIVDL